MNAIKYILAGAAVCMSIVGCHEIEKPANTIPTVTTNESLDVESRLTGSVSSPSGIGFDCYFLISNSSDMTEAWDEGANCLESEDGVFSAYSVPVTSMEGLSSGMTYYAVLCASDGQSEVRGNVVQFTMQMPSYLTIESIEIATVDREYTNDFLGVFLTDTNQEIKYYDHSAYLGVETEIPVTEPSLVYAYAYSEGNYSALDEIRVYDGNTDYFYGVADVTPENPRVIMMLHSAMAKVVFEFFEEDGQQVSMENAYLVSDGSTLDYCGRLDLTTGEIQSLQEYLGEMDLSQNDYEMYGFFIPGSFEEGNVKLRFDYQGNDCEYVVPASTWEAGQTYHINVDLTPYVL